VLKLSAGCPHTCERRGAPDSDERNVDAEQTNMAAGNDNVRS